jgi:hypothetical protein
MRASPNLAKSRPSSGGALSYVRDISAKSQWLTAPAIFILCVAPTFISYQPYHFTWDDADYLWHSIAVSRAFWSGDIHGLGVMVGIRPPVMTWLGLPWGPITSWDVASRCFITLAAVISLLASLCLYLLLRIGVTPLLFVAASVCTLASLGPYPPASRTMSDVIPTEIPTEHVVATGLYADTLLAWITLAALLLIPYEARTPCLSIRSAIMRGTLWGLILSLGAMTKVSFFYFIVFIIPTLFLIRLRIDGMRYACAAIFAAACSSAPFAFYLIRWGRSAIASARMNSFGERADEFHVSMVQFLGDVVRQLPGLVFAFALTVTALVYVVIKRRQILWGSDFLALLITIGFGIIVLASPNKQLRYVFPAIVALPFLSAVILSGNGRSTPRRTAALSASLALCGFLAASVPTGQRADRQSIIKAEAVLAQAAGCKAQRIVLATDSPTLNWHLVQTAIELSPSVTPVDVEGLADYAVSGVPIEQDFREIDQADQVVLQDKEKLWPPFTNQRVWEYEQHIRQGGYVPVRIMDDLSVYSKRCRP